MASLGTKGIRDECPDEHPTDRRCLCGTYMTRYNPHDECYRCLKLHATSRSQFRRDGAIFVPGTTLGGAELDSSVLLLTVPTQTAYEKWHSKRRHMANAN